MKRIFVAAALVLASFSLQAQGPGAGAGAGPGAGPCGTPGAGPCTGPGGGPGKGPGGAGPGSGVGRGPGSAGPGAGSDRGPGRGMRYGSSNTPGWSLMSADERREHRTKMRAMSTVDECKAYTEQQRKAMEARAKEKGVAIPGTPRVDMCERMKQRGRLK